MPDQLEVRERILKTADTLFHQQGYNETGINQIIKEAKVAKASLYYHFATKEELCIAYLQQKRVAWMAYFEEFLKGKKNKVMAAFDFILEDNEKHNFRGCSFLNMLSETSPEKENVFLELQAHKREVQLFFEKNLNDPELSYMIYSLFENAIIESQLFRDQAPVRRLKKIAASLIAAK